ncbi:MAG: type II secretion system F family protein [Pacificibacter sp.]|uniref:type II secretion system F family protein n=1 Tax=Pacificibacter sp. TaxID=1917866 RepID=UPI00321B648A
MNETFVLIAVFIAVLIPTFGILAAIQSRAELKKNLEDQPARSRTLSSAQIDEALGTENSKMRYYLSVMQEGQKNSLPMRLIQAGFLSSAAIWWFMVIRVLVVIAILVITQAFFTILFPKVTTSLVIFIGLTLGGCAFILTSAVLENMGKRRLREFKKLFPDFMDLLLVCIDAGLSIEAALDRVTREFLQTTPDFGVQLSIIGLEIRAGLPLHQAIANFSQRIDLEEARVLAVLFRQSEELGSSMSKTLRSFSKEMRELRIIKAEEKANALPVKMLFPMALFMFPVNLVIVLVPILIVIMSVLSGLTPQ